MFYHVMNVESGNQKIGEVMDESKEEEEEQISQMQHVGDERQIVLSWKKVCRRVKKSS